MFCRIFSFPNRQVFIALNQLCSFTFYSSRLLVPLALSLYLVDCLLFPALVCGISKDMFYCSISKLNRQFRLVQDEKKSFFGLYKASYS